MAASQADLVHEEAGYDLEVDTANYRRGRLCGGDPRRGGGRLPASSARRPVVLGYDQPGPPGHGGCLQKCSIVPCMRQSGREAGAGAGSIARAIGGRVRQGRGSRGWTLDQLAERSGVSRRMLVSIEQGAANPSIATLLRVSDALGIGLPALVDMGRSPGLRVTRAGIAPVLWRGKLGGQAVLAAGTEPPDVTELWDWTLGPGESHASEAHAAGTRELILVLDGRLELRVGEHAEVLAEGDSASFAGDLTHEYINAGSRQVARFALTVFEPTVGGGETR